MSKRGGDLVNALRVDRKRKAAEAKAAGLGEMCVGIDGGCGEPPEFRLINGQDKSELCMECLLEEMRDLLENNEDLSLTLTGREITLL